MEKRDISIAKLFLVWYGSTPMARWGREPSGGGAGQRVYQRGGEPSCRRQWKGHFTSAGDSRLDTRNTAECRGVGVYQIQAPAPAESSLCCFRRVGQRFRFPHITGKGRLEAGFRYVHLFTPSKDRYGIEINQDQFTDSLLGPHSQLAWWCLVRLAPWAEWRRNG